MFVIAMRMRLRLPELLDESGVKAYQLAKRSGLSLSTIYRLKSARGRAARFDRAVLVALCDVCGVGPESLFSRDDEAPPVPVRAPKRRAK
jgi:DNA-binding Xre family transcriptional regulator